MKISGKRLFQLEETDEACVCYKGQQGESVAGSGKMTEGGRDES